MKKVYFLLILLFFKLALSAQILAWQFGSPASAGNEATFTATTLNANLNTSVLSRGSGVNASALARAFSATNFPVSGTKTDAITNNRFFSFTVNAVSGFQTSLSTLDVRLRRSSSGPNMFIWRYSVDGTNFTDIGTDISFTSTVDGVDQTQIDLSVIPALQNVGSATTITFRLYAWGATATTGTFAIGRYSTGITTNSLALGGTVTLASSNSALSDIITDATFTTPTNINYSLYQGFTLTLANSIEVAKFTIRDGGGATDADAVGTILNSINFSLSNAANIRRVAIMDGSSQLQEVAGAAIISFNDPALATALATTDGGTKNFSIRVVFANNVSDNQQFQFAVTSTSTDIAGSSFAATNAGGATSSLAGDENRIEVIADGLSYLTNTFSPTGNGVAMAPVVRIGGTDTLNFSGNLYTNLDLDFAEQINITSTGTLTGSPITVAAVGGIATFAGLTHTVNGTGLTLNAERTTTLDWDAVSNPFDIINASLSTDYFRSVQSGNWNNPTTWESSPDNSSWQSSTLSPNNSANTITIRNAHTVTISTDTTADQIIIDAGGILRHPNSTLFTLLDGPGLDMEINGTYEINGRRPIGLGFIDVNNAGHVLVKSNALPNESDDFASPILNTRITFKKGSYYDWNVTTSPAWNGQTYLTVGERATFRFLTTPNFGVGGGANTVINGILETLDTLNINGNGLKIFVNGIIGHDLIDASTSTSGFQITGDTAFLGGAGALLLPAAGLNVGTNVKLFMVDTKVATGNMSLTNGCRVILSNYDLTVTNILTGGTANAYVVTDGTGKLFQRFFTNGFSWNIPIGPTENLYNPIVINNGQNLHYGARVQVGINPAIAVPLNAVNRTWVIQPSAIPASPVDVTFNYSGTDGNAGFNYSANVEVGLYTSVWNVIQSNITPMGTYNVTTNVSNFGANIDAPMIIGNLGAILAVAKKITLTATKQNNTSLLSWQGINLANAKSYIIERSSNGINFTNIATNNSTAKFFMDANPLGGNNYYRIKCIEQNNAITYSNIIIVRHNANVVSISPSITTANAILTVNSSTNQKIAIVVTDAVGKRINSSNIRLTIGENKSLIQASSLGSGLYFVTIYFENGTTLISSFIKQ